MHFAKMKRFLPILFLPLLSIVSCERAKNGIEATGPSVDHHREAVAKFQVAQERFKKLIATVEDEKSFYAAKPELERAVSDWREVSAMLGGLQPPGDSREAEIRGLIADVHDRTRLTRVEMLRLVSIASRAAEVNKWLEAFNEAGGKAMSEMARLYGSTEYSFAISDVRVKEPVQWPPTSTIDTGWVDLDPSASCPETHYPVIVEIVPLAGDGESYKAVFLPKPKGDFDYRSVVGIDTSKYETLNRELSGKGFVQVSHQAVTIMRGHVHQATWVWSGKREQAETSK